MAHLVPIKKREVAPKGFTVKTVKRRTRIFLMDGSSVDTPLTMFQVESFIQSAGRVNVTPFLRTLMIDKSGRFRSTLISYGFIARVDDLESYS